MTLFPTLLERAPRSMLAAKNTLSIASIGSAAETGADLTRLPFSVKVVLEALLRNVGDGFTSADDVTALANWTPGSAGQREIAFKPARVLMQDFTGVPAVVDLAAMRDAMQQLGGDPSRINPLSPGRPGDRPFGAGRRVRQRTRRCSINAQLEFERNRERYEFLRWGQQGFRQLQRRAAGHRHRATRSTWSTWPRWC